jgi:hypothetical protein
MKKINNAILGCCWTLGLILVMGSVDSLPIQVVVNLTGLAIFGFSAWGLIVNNRG